MSEQARPELEALVAELREALAPGLILIRELGEGGMGTVFLARDPALKRNVVVKVLSPALAVDERARRRFAREAEAAAAVAHPNVVSVFQVGELPRSNTSYFVMQYVEGQTLEAACPPGTPVPVARVKRIIGEIASALAAAHARGLVHRDIKPANVMLEAESDRVTVLDFGISAAVSPERLAQSGTRLTLQGMSVGTPQYMSPEQAAGEDVTDRSDVYSLGLIAFELLTGKPVFEERTPMALAAAHIHREPPKVASLRTDLEPAFADLVDGCLLKEPAERPTAADIARMLVPPAQPRIEWPPPGLERVHGRGWKVSKWAAWTAGAAAAVVLLMYLQPAVGTGAWAAGERSWLWRALWAPQLLFDNSFVKPVECAAWAGTGAPCPASIVDALPVWLFALAALCAFAAVGFLVVTSKAGGLVRVLRSGRKAGYPWPLLMAVTWDAGPDTGALLNGQGPFVLLTGTERDGLIRRRRTAQRGLLGGAALTVALPMLWLLGVVVLGDAHERTVTTAELFLFTGPLLAGIAAWTALRRPERRLRARGRRAAPRGKDVVEVAPALVQGWLSSAGSVAGQPGSRVRTVAAFAAPVAVAAAAVLLLLPMLFYALALSAMYGPTMRTQAQAWLTFAWLPHGDSWKSIDQQLQLVIARMPGTKREVRRVLRPGAVLDTNWVRGPDWMRNAAAGLVRDTVWRWLPQWRRAIADIGTRDAPGSDTLPSISINEYEGPLRAYYAAGLAFDAGDSATGWAWLREALTAARYLFRQGSQVWIVGDMLRARGRLAEYLGDTATAMETRDLRDRIDRHAWSHFVFYPLTPYTLMADPASPPGERFIEDTSLAPWVRRRLAMGAVGGLCLNTREWLFGMSPLRRKMIERVGAGSRDLPSVGRQARTLAASYDSLRSRRGLSGSSARIVWCMTKARLFSN